MGEAAIGRDWIDFKKPPRVLVNSEQLTNRAPRGSVLRDSGFN
jgi:hypothetical protein